MYLDYEYIFEDIVELFIYFFLTVLKLKCYCTIYPHSYIYILIFIYFLLSNDIIISALVLETHSLVSVLLIFNCYPLLFYLKMTAFYIIMHYIVIYKHMHKETLLYT